MIEGKRLSIVIATYNGERFLKEQIDSLYAQTLAADEVIAVDDCSSDGTVAILEEYRQKYGLQYVVNEHNLRVNKNFEKGIRMSTGDYISLCDQDDVWFREKNELLCEKLFELEARFPDAPCIVSSRNIFVDEKLRRHHSTELAKDTDDYRDTILHHLSQGSSMVFNRKCLDSILPLPDAHSGICYDSHIGYIVAMIGHKYDLRQALMLYRVHGNNVTARFEAKTSRKNNIRRRRGTGVVPDHMVRTFEFAHAYIEGRVSEDKMRYVKKIIALSTSISFAKRIWYVITLTKLPFRLRMYSLKAAIANRIFGC